MISFKFCAIVILLIIFLRRLRKRHFYNKLGQFRNASFLEMFQILLWTKGSPPDMFKSAHELLGKYGCFVLWFGFDTLVLTGRREDAQVIFNMRQKGGEYHFLKPQMGNGILTSNGEKWKKGRTILESAYGTKELSTNFLQIFNEESRLFIDEIQRKGLGVTHSFWQMMYNASARMTSVTIIGSGDLQLPHRYGSRSKKLDYKYHNVLQIMLKRVYSPWLHPDFMFNLYLFFTNQQEAIEAIRRYFIETLRKHKQLKVDNDPEVSETSSRPRKTVLDFLMKNDLTDEEIADELMTLMAGGTDTVATCTSFTLLMLAMNQDAQNEVVEELKLVFPGDEDVNLEMSDLYKLTFLEKCLKESLRKLSIISITERQVTSEVTLKDGRVVPVGTTLALSIYQIHNNPEYYPNPEVWNPHNFDENAVAKRPTYTFIPFSGGGRQCLGSKSAMMSMKIFVARILRHFKVTTSQTEAKIDQSLAARCRNGYHLNFEKR